MTPMIFILFKRVHKISKDVAHSCSHFTGRLCKERLSRLSGYGMDIERSIRVYVNGYGAGSKCYGIRKGRHCKVAFQRGLKGYDVRVNWHARIQHPFDDIPVCKRNLPDYPRQIPHKTDKRPDRRVRIFYQCKAAVKDIGDKKGTCC